MIPGLTFEELRASLETLEVPSGEARSLRWIVESRLGVAKTSSGDFEIFLLGAPVTARSATVRRRLEHGDWRPTAGGEPFAASRVVLPAAPHYAPIAALIATELARAGLAEGGPAQTAFDEVEPIIELAIRRGALAEEALLGLCGELLTLLTMLRSRPLSPQQKAVLVGAWQGWQQGRDFILGLNAIEVKATGGQTSTHAFSGLHQLEERSLPNGDLEALHVLSLGLAEVDRGGQSLPVLIDTLLAELGPPVSPEQEPTPLQAQLLGWIEQYGGSGRGYRHLSMRDWPEYQARYAISFARLYRVRDEAMRLLSREVVQATFVREDSLLFEATFPPRVSAFNPADQWQAALSEIVGSFLGQPQV